MKSRILPKTILALIFAFSFLLVGFADKSFAANYPGTNVSVKSGDIVVTRNTSSNGLTGHAGIVVNGTQIVHIAGYGYHPAYISVSGWFSAYPSTKVIRLNNSTRAQNAANWAVWYQSAYRNATYGLTPDIYGYNKTYCSKLVWQAYYYGNHGLSLVAPSPYVVPYDFINKVGYSADGKVVASVRW